MSKNGDKQYILTRSLLKTLLKDITILYCISIYKLVKSAYFLYFTGTHNSGNNTTKPFKSLLKNYNLVHHLKKKVKLLPLIPYIILI